jgi:hypothetical protein
MAMTQHREFLAADPSAVQERQDKSHNNLQYKKGRTKATIIGSTE